jgi:ribonuclease E
MKKRVSRRRRSAPGSENALKATDLGSDAPTTTESAVAAEKPADAPVDARRPRARRRAPRRRGADRAAGVLAPAEGRDDAPDTPADQAGEGLRRPQVEQTDDAIVIRFPPARGASAAEPAAGASRYAATPAAPARLDEVEDEDERVEQMVSLFEEAEQPPLAPSVDRLEEGLASDSAAVAPFPSAPGPGERPLTASQKRRQRRRRRAKRFREQGEPTSQDLESAKTVGRGSAVRPAPSAALPAEQADLDEPPPPMRVVQPDVSEPGAAPATEARGAARGAEPTDGRRRRGRRRRHGRRWERDDVAAFTEAEQVAGVSEPDEPLDLESVLEAAPSEPTDVEAEEDESEPRRPADLSGTARKEMIINVVPNEECRIALLESGKLEEIYFERASAENHVGNIYKGVVTNVESSIQAAFVDFGLDKNGFLHISDLHPQYFPPEQRQMENVGRKLPRRSRPPIQRCLRRGQELLVQVTKEGIGTKGPTLTTYLSIPGRFLVMMPGMRRLGVSRRIDDDEMRDKLRSLMSDLSLPDDVGFIARTAAQNRTKRELQMDLNYLSRLWKTVEKRIKSERAPAELYRESDLVIRTIRDVFTSDIDRIIVDNHEVGERGREFLSIFSPRSRDAVLEYEGPVPIFHRYGIEAELERLHSRHVPLRSGGSLVIDQTEALVAIDVNSGRFRSEGDAESTAYKINLEAAEEIPRQLRLRDLGGVIVCDFIDMRVESHRREVERRLIKNLRQHKERAKVLRMSAFGIIEMTRQRQRASFTSSVFQDCHHCRGSGLVKTVESVALDVMRLLQLSSTVEHIHSIEVRVSPEVADLLQNRKRAALYAVETRNRRQILIRPDSAFGLDQVQIQCYDRRNRLVPHP